MKQSGRYLFLSVLLLPLLAAAAVLLGGWSPIEDPKDQHVVEIGQFAVSEYNKQSKAQLKFEQVVKGETQVVSGTNYRLVVAAKDGSATNNYEAVVWEKPWLHYKNLTSFKPVKKMP
ncbi:cysteine proteinase inhibitor 5-like [Mangifera indica]|uniref:cysteine proteinase inhibitor 5-like n=1 Tax=Mangifera indica TaxID=29780 RepID=UPI001CF9AE03|nr:cysteine proteinase inhibitor 5-like [Mangifera indica]